MGNYGTPPAGIATAQMSGIGTRLSARASRRNLVIDYNSNHMIAYDSYRKIKIIYLNFSLIGFVVVELFYLKVSRFNFMKDAGSMVY